MASVNTESTETKATETVKGDGNLTNTDTVEDTNISEVNNESSEATLAEVVISVSNNLSKPTITVSCGGSEMIVEKVGEDTEDKVDEENKVCAPSP